VDSRVLPIPFDRPENIIAMLEGRKTETRRVMVPQPKYKDIGVIDPYNKDYNHFTAWTPGHKMILGEGNIKNTCHWRPPHGKPGDQLWVREGLVERLGFWYYKADGKPVVYGPADPAEMVEWAKNKKSRHCSSRYMPRFASRFTLDIVALRCERLGEITEEGAKAEGVAFDGTWWRGGVHEVKGSLQCWPTARRAFQALWDSIHGKSEHCGAMNPWCWVYTYKVALVGPTDKKGLA
jgi:hypothetical protein